MSSRYAGLSVAQCSLEEGISCS